jgi:hypothetical protein
MPDEVDLSCVTFPADGVTLSEDDDVEFEPGAYVGISLNIIRFRPFTPDEPDEEE